MNMRCFSTVAALLVSGGAIACPNGLGPIVDSDSKSTVCARDTVTNQLWCTNNSYVSSTGKTIYTVIGGEVPPSTDSSCLPPTGIFYVYDVQCPRAGRTVSHFTSAGIAVFPPEPDVTCPGPSGPRPPGDNASCLPPPNTTMVAWYSFDETAGTTAADLAAGNAGSYFVNPAPAAGMVAGALSFNGSSYVDARSTMLNN